MIGTYVNYSFCFIFLLGHWTGDACATHSSHHRTFFAIDLRNDPHPTTTKRYIHINIAQLLICYYQHFPTLWIITGSHVSSVIGSQNLGLFHCFSSLQLPKTEERTWKKENYVIYKYLHTYRVISRIIIYDFLTSSKFEIYSLR